MATILLYFLFVLAISHTSYAKTIEVKRVEKCEADEPIDLEFQLTVNDENEKVFNMKANPEYDIEENYSLKLNMYYLKNGNWEKDRSYDDKWHAFVGTVSRLWAIAKAFTQPPFPDGKVIPAGEYNVEGLHLKDSDMVGYVDVFNEGSYKVNLYLNDDEDKSLMCVLIELDVNMM